MTVKPVPRKEAPLYLITLIAMESGRPWEVEFRLAPNNYGFVISGSRLVRFDPDPARAFDAYRREVTDTVWLMINPLAHKAARRGRRELIATATLRAGSSDFGPVELFAQPAHGTVRLLLDEKAVSSNAAFAFGQKLKKLLDNVPDKW